MSGALEAKWHNSRRVQVLKYAVIGPALSKFPTQKPAWIFATLKDEYGRKLDDYWRRARLAAKVHESEPVVVQLETITTTAAAAAVANNSTPELKVKLEMLNIPRISCPRRKKLVIPRAVC